MDYSEIAMAGLLGGVFGGLGALLSTLITKLFLGPTPDPKTAQALKFVPIVCAVLGSQLARVEGVRELVNPPSRFERTSRKYGREFLGLPAVKQRMKGLDSAGASAAMQAAAHAGLKRLPPADLETWNDLRVALAESSPPVCAMFWSGKVNQSTLQTAVEALDDARLDSWVRTSLTSARLELEASGPVPDEPDGLAAGLDRVRARLGPAEQARFDAALAAGTSLDDAAACEMMKLLLHGAQALEPEPRLAFLRSMAAL